MLFVKIPPTVFVVKLSVDKLMILIYIILIIIWVIFLLVYVTEQDLMVQIVYGLIKPVSFYFSVHVVVVLFISSFIHV